VGDWGYEGDSGYLAHLGSVARPDRAADRGDADRRDTDQPNIDQPNIDQSNIDQRADEDPAADRRQPAPPVPADHAAAGVARRLQARLDRHIWLLERLQAEQLHSEAPGLPELQDTAVRMRRDTESMLLLCGHEPGVRTPGPRPLADVVADAAAAAEEPRRVEVRPGPAALVSPAAAVEFLHVLAELVDHVTAVYPGARLELVARLEEGVDGRGVTVDAVVDGAVRHDPDGLGGRRAAAAAEQLAQRSRHGIALRRPPTGAPPTGSGLVASVRCPPVVVTVEEPVVPPPRLERPEPVLPARVNGSGLAAYGNGARRATAGVNGTATEGTNGGVRPTLSFGESPTYSPSPSSQVDELFGPLLDLPLEPIDDRYATPIFEAIASAWFREGDAGQGGSGRPEDRDPGAGAPDWETPQDDEWRAAAARAARSDPEPSAPTTATGLPRRRPGNQLVPPPRATGSQNSGSHDGGTRGAGSPGSGSSRNGGSLNGGAQNIGPVERVPDRVRDRLSTYQRGLREGRHRAGPDGSETES
jgi:hypothetical protein